MADDEAGPLPESTRPGQATPNRGFRREPPQIDGTAEEVISGEPATGQADEPSRPWSDTASPAAGAPVAPPPRASAAPTLLSLLALLVALGAAGYTYWTTAAERPNDPVAGVSSDVGRLDSRVAVLESRPQPSSQMVDLKPVEDRIGALEATATQLKSDLADTRNRLDELANKPAPAAPAPVADASAAAPSPAPDLGPLQSKVDGLGQAVSQLQAGVAGLPKVDIAPLAAKVDGLGQSVTALQDKVAALPRIDLAPLEARVSALDSRLAPIEGEFKATKSDQRVTEARQEGSAAGTHAAPVAVTAQALLQAIDEGRSFAPEVSALKSLHVPETATKPLEAVAARGAPTQAALIAGFEEVRGAIVRTSTPKPTGTVLDRVLASAQSVVKVRPAGEDPGNDPDAVASRISAALQAGHFADALTAWNALPEAGQTASQAWADKLKARVDAEAAARSIQSGAIEAIASTP